MHRELASRPWLPALAPLLAAALLAAAGAPGAGAASPLVITELADATGDDHGPGSYLYPTDPVFTAGAFDLTRFSVSIDGARVVFELEIAGALTNPWNSPDGFSLQSVDIFIDQDGVSGSGATWTPAGRNVAIGARNAWERFVWLAPRFDDFEPMVVRPDGSFETAGIEVTAEPAARRLRLTAPVTLLGTPQPGWHYAVAMLSQDGFQPGRVRPVQRDASAWLLGGGDDGGFDANIIDLVLAPGLSQEGMLARYDPALGVQPTLYATPDGVPPAITHAPVTAGEAHRPIAFDATILDEVVAGAWARYRSNGGPRATLPLARVALDDFAGTLAGAQVTEGTIAYFLLATDGLDSATAPPDSAAPFVITVGPDVTPPQPTGLAAEPDPFSPNGDGWDEETTLSFTLPEPATVAVSILTADELPVRLLASGLALAEGATSLIWDGRDQGGAVVPDGPYLFRVEAVDLAGRPASADGTVTVDSSLGPRQLDLVFLFHFNQNLVPYARVGNLACYTGLLQTLRAHPSSRFMIHFSGVLLQSLLWFDRTAIDLIQAGVDDGQFELAGSTYAQNIMYSTRSDSLDLQQNGLQIDLHRRLLEQTFGIAPSSFWNAERVWTQSFAGLLAAHGYQSVQIEDHILERAAISGSEYRVRTTSYGGATVNVFDDDKAFEAAVNGAIDAGDPAPVLQMLDGLWQQDTDDEYAVTYHEDAEATGLWDYEGGEPPAIDWAHLDALLTAIEADPRFRLTTYGAWLAGNTPAENVTPIPDGAADWMGRDGWFAENAHPVVEGYRSLFGAVRDSLNATRALLAAAAGDTTAAARLLDHAWRSFAAHQYEFGVLGSSGNVNGADWQLVRSALVAARAARHALGGLPAAFMADVDDDGESELVLAGASDLLVLSPHGGRLLAWFDLARGVELVGNENFLYYGEDYAGGAHWHDVLAGGSDVYPWLAGNPIFPEIFDWTFEIRRRGLADFVTVNGGDQGDLRNAAYTAALDGSTARFTHGLAGGVTLIKEIRLESEGVVRVDERFTGGGGASIGLTVQNGLSPDLVRVMDGGRPALAFWDGDSTAVFHPGVTGVVNTASGELVTIEPLAAPSGLDGRAVVFGLDLDPSFSGTLPAGGELLFSLRLRHARAALAVGGPAAPSPPPGAARLLPARPNPFNPATWIPFELPARGTGSAAARRGAYALAIYDAAGRSVRRLARGGWGPAALALTVRWDGRDGRGRSQPSGVYFVRLVVDGQTAAAHKLVLVR